MRAVLLREFGSPVALSVAEVPDPIPGPGQVLIEVEVVNITFVETLLRSGRPPHPSMAPRLPVILGNGVGGRVSIVGEGVDASLVGARVISSTGGSGGYAEQVAVAAAGLIAVPDSLGLDQAVALLADGRTALALIRAATPTPGETVMVEAAAGGVGSLLVQLASQRGAKVVAAAAGERKLQLALDLGATVAVDYTEPAWTDRVRAEAGEVDVVFDGVGGAIGKAAFDLVRRGGRFHMFGGASGTFTSIRDADALRRSVTVTRGVPVAPADQIELARAAIAMAAAGRLRPVIGQTFSLEEAGAAHAAIEARKTIGKTLLLTQRPPTDPGSSRRHAGTTLPTGGPVASPS